MVHQHVSEKKLLGVQVRANSLCVFAQLHFSKIFLPCNLREGFVEMYRGHHRLLQINHGRLDENVLS